MNFKPLNLRSATLMALAASVLYFLLNLRYIESLSWLLLTGGWTGMLATAQCLLRRSKHNAPITRLTS